MPFTIVHAKRLNRQIAVVARTSDPEFFPVFKELSVTEVVLPEFEAGLEMTRQVLLHLRIPVPEIQQCTESLRRELFAPLFNSVGDYKTLAQLRLAEQQFDLQWVILESGSPFIDKSIAEAEIRKATGASVVGVVRDGKLEPNPDTQLQLRLNDLVAIIGSDQAREAFRRMSRSVEGVARKGGEKGERENLGSRVESVSEGSSGIK